jgi:glycosyltransferase involved in cell wall biosynthesis
MFLSINRYERKKNIALAVDALARLQAIDRSLAASSCLVIAGGYDTKVAENVEHHAELVQRVRDHGNDVRISICKVTRSPCACRTRRTRRVSAFH